MTAGESTTSTARLSLGIMQPYFFPYIGYFDLMNQVDLLVLYDTAQFPQQGWVNRNRILHPVKHWQYLTVPLEKASFVDSFRTRICDVRISASSDWQGDLVDTLEIYSQRAPNFDFAMQLIHGVLSGGDAHIASLDARALTSVARELGIQCDVCRSSELGLSFGASSSATDRLIQICHEFGAERYVNLPGGRSLYTSEAFERAGIELIFTEPPLWEYETPGFEFQQALSIIDVLMWNPVSEVRRRLRNNAD